MIYSIVLLRLFAWSGWGADVKVLQIKALSLVYSTSEFCAQIWHCNGLTCLIDSVLNDAMSIVTGCLRPTPTNCSPIPAGIQPAELCRQGATLSLVH